MGKIQKRKIGYLALLVLGICLILEFLIPPRQKYHVIDFENDLKLTAEFYAEYKKAIANNNDWVKDAETVALCVAGYPNIDGIQPAQIDMETAKDGMFIVTILSRSLSDDSIDS